MKVAFHTINGVGLGHVVRSVTLASEIRALVPGVRLLVLTNAVDTSMIARAGLDFVQLPPRLAEPHADPDRARIALPEPLEEGVLVAALEAFRPDLVVFDTHAPIRIVRHVAKLGARAVLVLRELRAEALRSFVKSGAALEFDRIVVPQEPGEMDLTPLAGLPVALVGPIVRRLEVESAPSTTPLVVAMAGGGGQPLDGRRYLRAVADAHILVRARIPNVETVLVAGPYGDAPPEAPGLTVCKSRDDLAKLIARATLVVSQAGYNAIAEIRALAKPAIVVPGHRKAEDQRARALRLVRAKAAVLAKPEARAIADRIEALLEAPAKLAAMTAAHRAWPLVAKNRFAAEAVLRPCRIQGSTPRRVVIVAPDFAPKLGGMESVARGLAKSLLAQGIDVRIYTTNRLGVTEAHGLGEGIVEPLYRAPIDLESDLLMTIDAALRDAPDVIHLCNAGLAPWIPALRAALPCVVTANVHGNDLLAPWIHSPLEARTAGLSQADAVLCVSRFSRDLAERSGVRADVLHVIENGVDPERFAPRAAPNDDEIVLTVSRLAPRKGHRTVLRAIARLARKRPALKYVFTGASEAMRAELARLAMELGIHDRVIATGFVPDDALPALYRDASVFALLADAEPNDVEGFGVALLEAAAAGLPTLASNTGGIPEAIVDGETGFLISPGDDATAAEAIEKLLDDRALARRLGSRGRERVIESFSEERAAERTFATWKSALGHRTLAGGSDGVELTRQAQRRGAERRTERAARRASFVDAVARGRRIRLRATGDGARLLPDALADCRAIEQKPRVEIKLRRFLEADFAAYALPHVEGVELVHGIPHVGADAIFASLEAMPAEALARVRIVRLFCANADAAAVPEAHALRRFFSARGITVVPPPELMRYLSEQPALGPETAMIEPTNLCNLACPTCPTGTGKIKPLPQMTLERFEHALDALGPRVRNLALWNYGEPLLNRDLPKMIDRAKRTGVRVVKVSSNVHFLDGERGAALLRSGLDVLILSVDGASQETYATFRKDGDFDRVGRAVVWLCAEKKRLGLEKPRIELQFIVMRHNEHELPAMRQLARTWGVDRLRIKTVGADDPETKNLVPAERLLSRYQADGETPNVRHPFCTMPWDHAVVNVDGSVTPCCYLRPDMGDAFVMGNIFESEFSTIWRGERYRAFRSAMLDGRKSLPVCNRCRGGTHDLVAAIEEVS
jgi:radical SAM protein with 4Fe4S-binding SPASM domain